MVGEQLAALFGLFIGTVIGISMSIIVVRHRSLAFPLIPTLITVLSAAMAIDGLIGRDLTVISTGAILALCIHPLIWKASNNALRIAYSVLLITISVLYITTVGIGMILRLAGILALVGMIAGIVNIIMLAKH